MTRFICCRKCISIHALREEGDIKRERQAKIIEAFLSTPSARRATDRIPSSAQIFRFLSTPSARRATLCYLCLSLRRIHFYPRPPRGGRR